MNDLTVLRQELAPLEWAAKACASLMATYRPEELPPAGRWHYHQGVFLLGMQRLWEITGEERYFDYVRGYVDHLIDADGAFERERTELDSMQAGCLLYPILERTGDERYRKALDSLIGQLATFNRTRLGGFWHKEKYPDQQWLDGLYMIGPVTVRYARLFNRPELFDLITLQARLIYDHTLDARTGLLRHAYDESRRADWADPVSGIAPEAWGRAMGWVSAGILDILDDLPPAHKDRKTLEAMVKNLMSAVVRVQEKSTGLWYQVLDKGDRVDNWLETSCSSLFVYSLCKGRRKGRREPSLLEPAVRGFRGTLGKTAINEAGLLEIRDICIGTG
ncbi:MAG: glycoside hydrolase family 88 protein, partial [Firmicutes bacterium]|nr:glycoside hydrolase family 88 protein [Bacillota bacterium]